MARLRSAWLPLLWLGAAVGSAPPDAAPPGEAALPGAGAGDAGLPHDAGRGLRGHLRLSGIGDDALGVAADLARAMRRSRSSGPSGGGNASNVSDAPNISKADQLRLCLGPPPFAKVRAVVHNASGAGDAHSYADSAFALGAVAKVGCAEGFRSSEMNWTSKCMGNNTWKPVHHCRPACNVPVDPLGTWQGRPGSDEKLFLECADGYVAQGGAVVLPCHRAGAARSVPGAARCVPGMGDAEEWRSSLRYSALFSLLGVGAVLVVVVGACWREAPRHGGPGADTSADRSADRRVGSPDASRPYVD